MEAGYLIAGAMTGIAGLANASVCAVGASRGWVGSQILGGASLCLLALSVSFIGMGVGFLGRVAAMALAAGALLIGVPLMIVSYRKACRRAGRTL